MATTDICVSNCHPSSSSSSSSLQPVDAHSALLERQRTCRTTTTRFSVEDIMRPDFGERRAPWRSNDNVRLMDAGLCCSLTNVRQLSSSTSSLTPCNASTTTTSTATSPTPTLSDEVTQSKTTSTHSDRTSLSVEVLPAWIFCTRYSDRPSSGIDAYHLHEFDTVVVFIASCTAVATSSPLTDTM